MGAEEDWDFLSIRHGFRYFDTPDDVDELILACSQANAHAVHLFAENLTERFFDLRSGEAKFILQKLREHGIRVAIVVPSEGFKMSRKFRQMVAEGRKRNDFRVFDDADLATAWLRHGCVGAKRQGSIWYWGP